MKLQWVGLLVGMTVVGCGSGVGRPVAQFPSKAELEKVAAQPARPKTRLKTAPIETWQLAAQPAAVDSAYPSETTWDRLLLQTASQRHSAARPSAALRCAAQEAARFYVQNAAYPDDGLRRFLVARCGSSLAAAAIQTLSTDVPDQTPDAALESNLQKAAKELVDELLKNGQSEVGLGYARANGRATLVAFTGVPGARLKAFSPHIDGNSVTLEGDVPQEIGLVSGFVTDGLYGVKVCEPDRRFKLPRFRFSCPVAESDAQAEIEIATGKPNEVFWHVGARAFVSRAADANLTYQGSLYGATPAATNGPTFQRAVFDGLNRARAQAGLRPLELEVDQSHTNEKLVPHFFESSFAGNAAIMDEIGLGLLAGWDVKGLIRTGSIYSGTQESSHNPGYFLSDALSSPFGRWVLMEPGMTRIAIGSGDLAPSGVMTLITTYAFFESQDHRADESAVFEELSKMRQARGLAPARRLPTGSALQAALARIAVNQQQSDNALQDALARVADEQKRGVGGYVLETNDLQHLSLPEALLAASVTELQVGITHYRAPGGAWGQYAILFVYYDNGSPTKMAQRPARQRF
jgi:hypothetical protein